MRTKLFITAGAFFLLSFALAMLAAATYPSPFAWVYGSFSLVVGILALTIAMAGVDS